MTNEYLDPNLSVSDTPPVARPQAAEPLTSASDAQNDPQDSAGTSFNPEALKKLITQTSRTLTPIMNPNVEVHDITDVSDALVPYKDIIPSTSKRKIKPLPKTGITQKWIDQFLPWVEQFWHKNKYYPHTQDLIQEFNIDHPTVVALHNDRRYLKCLDRRGITRPDIVESFLTDKQVAAIALITNINDQRHQNTKLAAIGVTLEQYNGWLQNTSFKKALQERSENAFNNAGVDANLAIATLVKNNDFRAVKFYMEMTGRAETPEAINVKRILQITLEAVQKHVKDVDTLRAIASEIQTIRELEGLK